jgi:hypothetical protein
MLSINENKSSWLQLHLIVDPMLHLQHPPHFAAEQLAVIQDRHPKTPNSLSEKEN